MGKHSNYIAYYLCGTIFAFFWYVHLYFSIYMYLYFPLFLCMSDSTLVKAEARIFPKRFGSVNGWGWLTYKHQMYPTTSLH